MEVYLFTSNFTTVSLSKMLYHSIWYIDQKFFLKIKNNKILIKNMYIKYLFVYTKSKLKKIKKKKKVRFSKIGILIGWSL